MVLSPSDVALVQQSIDLWALENYDFDPTLHCEYSLHQSKHVLEDPAKYLIQVDTECGCRNTYLMCQSGLNRMVSFFTLNCPKHGTNQLFDLRILETVNP